MIYVYYKRKEWTDWAVYSCSTKDEAEKVRATLIEQGYEVRKY